MTGTQKYLDFNNTEYRFKKCIDWEGNHIPLTVYCVDGKYSTLGLPEYSDYKYRRDMKNVDFEDLPLGIQGGIEWEQASRWHNARYLL